MTPPDTRVAPLPAGTLCTLDGREVRAYARIWPGQLWDGKYHCIDRARRTTCATRDQLEVLHG